jgi:mono/diheme cytochrome c family protein
METRRGMERTGSRWLRIVGAVAVVGSTLPAALSAQLFNDSGRNQATANAAAAEEVTFARDIAPILQRNCQVCHRPNGPGPMSLVSYEEVRPWASVIAYKTGLRDRAGAMPPYYLERRIGIQELKNDERLEEHEIQMIADWAAAGAPRGDDRDMPAPIAWDDSGNWRLGEPDLVVKTQEFFVEAGSPDWWGDMDPVPTGLTEDRWVRAVEIREVNTVSSDAAGETSVGGRWIFHHMIWTTLPGGSDGNTPVWPVHELGRNPDIFDPRAGRLLRAGSQVFSNSIHLHSSGEDTTGHLEIGFYFHPRDYEPEYRHLPFELGDGVNIDIRGGVDGLQELHSFQVLDQHTKIVSFEPHLHGPGARMCLQAVWGMQIETLSCAGYDHNWVKQYVFDDDHAPILPKGTVLHLVGFMDMTPTSPNVPDPRNWQGSGNRSITNMFIDLGNRVGLSDEQFVREMAERRERLGLGVNDHVIGCPLCMAAIPPLEESYATTDAGDDQ